MRTARLIRQFGAFCCAILLGIGCATNGDPRTGAAPARPAPAAEARAREVAADAERKATRTEKAEGAQDLARDRVAVRTDGRGEAVVEQVGEASWYGRVFQGEKTANGERFDHRELTAAHPTLPLGTRITVTNLDNGRSVEAVVNDRGPYAKGRDLDLSRAAAERLGIVGAGAAPVKIEAKASAMPR